MLLILIDRGHVYKDLAAVQSLTELVNWSNTQALARDLENVHKCSSSKAGTLLNWLIFFLNHYINWFPINSYVCELFGSLQIFLTQRFRRAPSIYGLPSSFVQEYFCLFELLFKQSKANKFESLYIWTINNMTFEPLLPCLTTTTHANDHRKRMSCVHSLSEVNHH